MYTRPLISAVYPQEPQVIRCGFRGHLRYGHAPDQWLDVARILNRTSLARCESHQCRFKSNQVSNHQRNGTAGVSIFYACGGGCGRCMKMRSGGEFAFRLMPRSVGARTRRRRKAEYLYMCVKYIRMSVVGTQPYRRASRMLFTPRCAVVLSPSSSGSRYIKFALSAGA